MSLFYLDKDSQKQSVGALALGSFDGVHLGHAELVKHAVKASEFYGEQSAVLCFAPNPKEFFSTPEKPYLQIYGLDQNAFLLKELGADLVCVKDFDLECSRMTAGAFLDLLYSRLNFKELIVGFDFKFGHDRQGGKSALQAWCARQNVKLKTVECLSFHGDKVSSSLIKEKLLSGEIGDASSLLGRAHSYIGLVRSDQGLGKQIGFPTLNISLNLNTAIRRGVYASTLYFEKEVFYCLSNIGVRPTVSESSDTVILETHILSEGLIDIPPGSRIKVELKQFLRAEKKFPSLDELKIQIAEDVNTAKSLIPR